MHIYDRDGLYRQWLRRKKRDELLNAALIPATLLLVLLGVAYFYVEHF